MLCFQDTFIFGMQEFICNIRYSISNRPVCKGFNVALFSGRMQYQQVVALIIHFIYSFFVIYTIYVGPITNHDVCSVKICRI